MLLLLLWACARDADGDGFRGPEDCDDGAPMVHPAAVDDTCDGVDDDCDGWVDEAASGARFWYRDADGDGYGVEATYIPACQEPTGYADNLDDCDDAHATAHPGGMEGACDGIDNDCDGDLDEDDPDATTWYPDDDGDGWGDEDAGTLTCTAPDGFIGAGQDCDDAALAVNPDGIETCGDADEDCDGIAEEGCPGRATIGLDAATTTFVGSVSSFGWPVAWVSDGDGGVDLLVGTEGDGAMARLFDGASTGELAEDDAIGTLLGPGVYQGRDLAAPGDIDGDGADDAIVRTYGDVGEIAVFGGPLLGDVASVATITGDPTFGENLAPAVGGFVAQDASCARLFAGPFEGEIAAADGASACGTGDAAIATGDFDGDGVLGLAVEASPGVVAVVGLDDGIEPFEDAATTLTGDGVTRLAAVGDVDGDGIEDLGVADSTAGDVGALYVMTGIGGHMLVSDARTRLDGAEDDAVGTLIERCPDIDGDGRGEVLVVGDQAVDAAIYVLAGDQAGTVAADDAAAVIAPELDSWYFGYGLATDDSLGHPRVVLGASALAITVTGRAWVFWEMEL